MSSRVSGRDRSKELKAKRERLAKLRADRDKREKNKKLKDERLQKAKAAKAAKARAAKAKGRKPKPKLPQDVLDVAPSVSSTKANDIADLLASFTQITAGTSEEPAAKKDEKDEEKNTQSEQDPPDLPKLEKPKRKVELTVNVQPRCCFDYMPVEIQQYEAGTQIDEDEIDKRNAPSKEQQEKEREKEEELETLRREHEEMKSVLDNQKQKERDNEEIRLLEEKRKELSAAEIREIGESTEFEEFVEKASLHIERALAQSDNIDVMFDYFAPDDVTADAVEQKESIVPRCEFHDQFKTSNRPITSCHWSPQHPELMLASYASSEDMMSDKPDGLVLIWNQKMTSRPERVFTCQSAVLIAQFHPTDPKLLIGGTYSGQVVIWDTRQKHTPIVRTKFSLGHSHPLYSLVITRSVQNRENIITVSNDGRLCVWDDHLLLEPKIELDLQFGREEITTSCIAVPTRDPSLLILGSDEGYVYKARIHDDKPGIKSGIQSHSGPITTVAFHPADKQTPKEVADLYLTSSYDWTCKLWSNQIDKALIVFEQARDYVHDIQWSPIHPSLFAMVDGSGIITLWNLLKDTEVPILTKKLSDHSLSRIQWSNDGKHIAVGDAIGKILIYEINPEVAIPGEDDASKFYQKIKNIDF